MPVTRSFEDANHVTGWTRNILEIPNQSSFIKDMGLFDATYTNQEAIAFDKVEHEITLLADVNRRGGPATYGKDQEVSTYTLPLGYFRHMDAITKQDYMGKRRAGSSDQEEIFANVLADKLKSMRAAVDQTHEYMYIQAIKGNTVTPSGTPLANMFSLFGISQTTVDFELGTDETNVHAKIAKVKDTVIKNLKTGGLIRGPLKILVDRSFFDKLINHPQLRADYLNSTSNVRYQEDLSKYYTWGISDVFETQGVVFMVYGAEFNLPDGGTEKAIETDTGHVVPEVMGDSIFRSVFGPSQRIDVEGGEEMFAWQFRDPRQFYHELMVETAPLMYCTKPAALVKVTTSN